MSSKEYAPSQAIRSCLHVILEDIFHSLYCLRLHVGEDVRVGVQGDGCRGVPEHLLNDLWMNSLGQKQGCTSVTEIVEPRVVGKCGSKKQGLPGTVVQVMDAYGRPDVGAEDPFASPLMFS